MDWIGEAAVLAAAIIVVINVGRILYHRQKLKTESKYDEIYAEIAKGIELQKTVLEEWLQEEAGMEQTDGADARNQENE